MKITHQRFYSRDDKGSIQDLDESFRKGHFFVERITDQKWLKGMVHPNVGTTVKHTSTIKQTARKQRHLKKHSNEITARNH